MTIRACSLAASCVLAASSFGQCVPEWDGAPGVIGIADGYAGAIGIWDDGGGERMYVGGSFSRIGGVNRTGFIGRWNPHSSAWSALGNGLSGGFTNGFVTSILPYARGNPAGLVVAGFFDNASGVANTRSLAIWNGAAWKAFPMNPVATSPASVWSLLEWDRQHNGDSRLYIGGALFANVNSTPSDGIQAWDGSQWHAVSTVNGDFSPTVFKLHVHTDASGEKLYAGGRFQQLQGQSIGLIGRWDGTTWTKVGGGLTRLQSFGQISAMTTFDDGTGPALYVGGGYFRITGANQTATSVAKWNGTTWSRVGQDLGGFVYGLEVFDDGEGPKLYCAGTAQPSVNYIARLENGVWVTIDGGLDGSVAGNFPSAFAIRPWGDRLVVAGDFTSAGTEPANGIVFRTSCSCPADFNGDGFVNGDDFDAYVAAFEAGDDDADFDGNGFVNGDDFDAYGAAFEAGCE